MVGHQHIVLRGILSHHHGLPAIFLVELQADGVAGGVGNHVVVAGAHRGIVPDVKGGGQVQRLLDGGAAVKPEPHYDGGSHVVLFSVLLRRLLGEGHDGGAEARLVDSVHRSVDGGQAAQLLHE